MTRSIGPRDNDRVAYRSDGTATAQEAAVQLCTDAALQTPADVLTPGGAVIANSTVLVDELSRYPLVQYPEGVQDLYTRIADGPVVRLRARVSESSTGTVPPSTTTPLSGKADASVTISTTAPLTGGGDLSGNRALAVSDATSGAKGVLQLAGDLTGSAGAPAVAPGAVTSAKIADGAIVDGDVNASAAIGGAKLAHLSGVLSAVSRTVQDTLRERVSVFDVMTSAERADAVSGSPVLDHTAAFNTIIASCAAAGLREYYIPPGTYRVEGTIVGAANVWGSGPHAATPNAAASHSVRINHVPPSGSVDLYTQFGPTGNYVAAGGFRNVAIQASPAGFTRRGFWYENVVGMDMYHLTMYGSFTDAHIALKGYLNCNIRKLRLSNNTSIATPSAFRLLSYDGDMYGTTLAIEDIYVSGHLNVAAGGITSVVKADPASGRGVHFIHPIFESINGIAFDIAKGNQVIVEKPYIENCPNSNANIPVFELGVTGAAAPNNAYDTATYLGIYGVGEEVIQYSQGAATLTRFINADVALAIDLFDIRLTRCITLVTGTNSTQQLKLRNVVSASVTTVTSGMTGYKVFDLGGNVFQFATLPETNGSGVDGVRDTLPATLLRHTALYASSDVGTEGRMAWYDKVNARWNSFRVKQGTAPTSRTWVRGDAVDNAFPSAGGATAWSCTASGTAGSATWQVAGQAGAAKGNTAARPTKTTMGLAAGASDLLWSGTMYLDTTLAAAGKPIWWSGSAWVDATGTAV